jgi:hypothetical protein
MTNLKLNDLSAASFKGASSVSHIYIHNFFLWHISPFLVHFRLSSTMVSSMMNRCNEQEQDVSSCSKAQGRFRCSLTREIMKEPVTSQYGDHFERKTIMKWIKRRGEACPLSGQSLKVLDLKPNSMLQWEILFCQRKNEDALDVSRRSAPALLLQEPSRKVDAPPSIVTRTPEVTIRKRLSDTAPSVPRRKHSHLDLSSLCDMMSNRYVTDASESSHPHNIATPDILRTLPMADVPMVPQFDSSASPLQPQGILSVLDQMEKSLLFDGF